MGDRKWNPVTPPDRANRPERKWRSVTPNGVGDATGMTCQGKLSSCTGSADKVINTKVGPYRVCTNCAEDLK